jgi:DNA adenine methylase
VTTKKTILRYAGGKSRAIKQITPYVEDYETIVSPFLGGGSLEVHWAAMGKKVIAADVFDILVNFWNVLLRDPNALADELNKISPTSEEYKEVKEALMCTPQVQNMLKDWTTDFYKFRIIKEIDKDGKPKKGPDGKVIIKSKKPRIIKSIEDVKLAAYYYFNHNTSYGPGFLGWPSKIYMNQAKWDKTIAKVRAFSSPNLSVTHQSFEDTIKQNPNSFLYLDPPYYTEKDEDNKMLCGIYPMKNIPVHHDSFDHELLRDCLLNHDGDFVLSYNNCETIREYYSDFDFFFPKWHYSMDIGEKRIGKNRVNRTSAEELGKVDQLTQQIASLEDSESDKNLVARLKSERHEIMKKESHEILIIKRNKNG